jgi:GDP-L-fucose synthase
MRRFGNLPEGFSLNSTLTSASTCSFSPVSPSASPSTLACASSSSASTLTSTSNVVIQLWGTGEPYREFLHVDDLADACIFIINLDEKALASTSAVASGLNPPTSMINVGVGKDHKIRELAERVKGIVGYVGVVRYDDSKPDGAPRKLLNVTRLRSLGWSPKISLEEGIKSTYEWYCGCSLR